MAQENALLTAAIGKFHREKSETALNAVMNAVKASYIRKERIYVPVDRDLTYMDANTRANMQQLQDSEGRVWQACYTDSSEAAKAGAPGLAAMSFDTLLDRYRDNGATAGMTGIIINAFGEPFRIVNEMIPAVYSTMEKEKEVKSGFMMVESKPEDIRCDCTMIEVPELPAGRLNLGLVRDEDAKGIFSMTCHAVRGDYSTEEMRTASRNELMATYYQALETCRQYDLHSIALPCLGLASEIRFPVEEAVRGALNVCTRWFSEHQDYGLQVCFAVTDPEVRDCFRKIGGAPGPGGRA